MSSPIACDVAVVGAGPAGLAAALAAARSGARTLLVDRGPRLGGNIANAFVHTICGLFEPADSEPLRRVHTGLPVALERALRSRGEAGEPERAGRVHVLPIRPAGFERLGQACLERSPGVELCLGAELVSFRAATAGEPHRLLFEVDGRRREAQAWVAIDASGDGDAACLAGAATRCEPAATLQHPSYIVRLRGVPKAALAGFARMQLATGVARAARVGVLPAGCDSVLLRPGGRPGEAHMTLNLPKPDSEVFDPLDASQRTRLAAWALEGASAVLDFLRTQREGFERAELDEAPARIGIRESRRVAGRVEITADHVIEGRSDPAEVARACWPLELWEGHERARFEHVEGSCSIPLGALIAAEQPRLGMAGRCMSATHEALGSLRVIGTAIATGEAIGAAAALAASTLGDLIDIDPGAVRDAIAKHVGEPLP
ncbi:MAG: FAD-dependent oxidoreductase [Myxococcota bacterium]|nr:FAD-dependent oxidoreductase [Myxococcota bacterium]